MIKKFEVSIVNALPHCIFLLDAEGKILHLNKAAINLAKKNSTNDEVYWFDFFDLSLMDNVHRENLNLALKSGKNLKLDRITVIRKKDHKELSIKIEIKKIDEDNSLNYTLIIVEDLEKEISRNSIIDNYKDKVKQQEEEFIHLDRLLTLNEMTTGFAHEINQPLTAITNYATASKYLLAANEQASVLEQLEEIIVQAERASQITQKIRDFTGTPYTNKSFFSINRLIYDSIKFLKNLFSDRKIVVDFNKEKTASWVTGDFIQIQQVLINILKNAVDAILESDIEHKKITISVERSDKYVNISIEDKAGGIPIEMHDKIFSPFQTTKSTGMGIGLAICKSIIDAHAGKITFNCVENKTIFNIHLPLSSHRAAFER